MDSPRFLQKKENAMNENRSHEKKGVDPEIIVDEKYREAYSDESFHVKAVRTAKYLGRQGLRYALILYYVLRRRDLPSRVRLIILGALGYFIFPIDILPDFLPFVGYADDIGVLAAAAAAVSMYADDAVKAQADRKLAELLD